MVECFCVCDYSCVKRSVLAFNIIFWFSGPAVLGLSIWFILTLEIFSPAIDVTSYKVPCYIIIGVGIACVIFGIFGCLGSVNENKKLLISFLFALVVTFTCEIYACVETFKLYDEVSSRLPRHLNFSIKYLYKCKDDATTAINRMQADLSCCGSSGYTDWQFSLYYRNATNATLSKGEIVPHSCCYDTNVERCNVATTIQRNPDILFSQGCLVPLEKWVKKKLLIFGWGSFGFCTFQILGIALSCCLCKAMSNVYG